MMRSPRRRMGRARADTYHVGNPIPFAIELANLLLIDLERKHHLMIQFCCLGMYRGQIESPPRNRVQDAHQCALRVAKSVNLVSLRNYAETDLSDNPDFVEIAKAYKIHAFRMKEDVMREFPVSQETGDQIDRFLRSPEPELLVFDCAPEANVFPMVPAGAALSEMLLEEK